MCGGTASWTWWSERRTVYPRVCGGTPAPTPGGSKARRSIPACAGEPCPEVPLNDKPNGLSPRVRGNRCSAQQSRMTPRRGLSPRVRGNQIHVQLAAGARMYSVYPRVCGGTAIADDVSARTWTGSIPACAGEPDRCYCSAWASRSMRSIPACAGEPGGYIVAWRRP